ncbi:GntR family transcriptional regulator [Streptomyces sp. NPDC005336]|uniref:GntR family transcriptional regulator n=1 Tax=Streptomyces sp. NPDC005336 TaxID=3157035 RepID=UPI0033AE8622
MARATGKSEAVYDRLKRDIETLRLTPGAKLSEVQLGEELGGVAHPRAGGDPAAGAGGANN